jgi:hypothetical protein
MYISIEQLERKIQGIETIVDRCIKEKWIRPAEKGGIRYLSGTDAYKLRFIFHLRHTGATWEEIPRHLTPGNLYSIEFSGEG